MVTLQLSRPCFCSQVYTIVTTALDGSSPQGRSAVVELLEKLQEPVQYMQELFQPISARVSQVWCCTCQLVDGVQQIPLPTCGTLTLQQLK